MISVLYFFWCFILGGIIGVLTDNNTLYFWYALIVAIIVNTALYFLLLVPLEDKLRKSRIRRSKECP